MKAKKEATTAKMLGPKGVIIRSQKNVVPKKKNLPTNPRIPEPKMGMTMWMFSAPYSKALKYRFIKVLEHDGWWWVRGISPEAQSLTFSKCHSNLPSLFYRTKNECLKAEITRLMEQMD